MTLVATVQTTIEVRVIAVSPASWRVESPARKSRGLIPLLGFIETVGDTFEVAELGTPLIRTYFSSLDNAVAFLGRSAH